jgi:hypothetical protein
MIQTRNATRTSVQHDRSRPNTNTNDGGAINRVNGKASRTGEAQINKKDFEGQIANRSEHDIQVSVALFKGFCYK